MSIRVNDQQMARLRKIDQLRSLGIDPYPPVFHATYSSSQLLESRESPNETNTIIAYAGRVVRYNRKGKICFMHIKDQFGKIQAVISATEVGDEAYEVVKLVDLGDWIGVKGEMFTTKTGEYSVLASQFNMLSKAIRPLPTPKEKNVSEGDSIKFDEFSDVETRYRQRYIDLAPNDSVRMVFHRRSQIIASLRTYLAGEGYMEVETPVLQPVYGGANAFPFVTHHNAADLDLYLRISNELYLKRCIIGGFERVFEFAKDFRNEGIDKTHNPEFTLLEFYQAFADYTIMMDHVETMIERACIDLYGTASLNYSGTTIDVSTPWRRIRLKDAVKTHAGIEVDRLDDNELMKAASACNRELSNAAGRGEMVNVIFEEMVAPELIQPHIVMDFFRESSPLCRSHRNDSDLIEQFEVYIGGMELCNSYSELVDPIEQRKRLEDQANQERRKSGGSHPVDADFLFALESGMPPTGGEGIGIDRLAMLLTDSVNIRDVLLFPLMKPITY